MRLRFAVPASLLAAFALAAAPAISNAAPHHNHGLTINATPDPIITGDGVMIYGQLNTPKHDGKTIVLYHRINPGGHFTMIETATTLPNGFYEFTREKGVVLTNRSWFVREAGHPGIHSRTIHEHVEAALSLAVSTLTGTPTTTGDTNHPLVYSGHVDPTGFHVGERVYLQEQRGLKGDDWTTLKRGRINASSDYSIAYKFDRPGVRDVRVELPGDVRNIRAASDTATVTIQQTQNPHFTINTTAPVIDDGSSATISGILYAPGSATVGLPGIMVTLYSHQDGTPYVAGPSTTTGAGGVYSFPVTPVHNTVYQVRTSLPAPAPQRKSAQLFEGVSDVVTINESSPTALVGQSVTFNGTVTPNKNGHVIELQRLGKDGDFHTVAVGLVDSSSAYKFVWTFGSTGIKTFRVRISGGPENVGGHSANEVVTVSPAALSSLPPAS